MSRRFQTLTFLLVMLAPIIARSQSNGPRLIDEFGRINSEEATARLQNATVELENRLPDHPDSKLEFVIYKGQKQSIGEPYLTFGRHKAYLAATHFDTDRIVSTICETSPKPYTQIWLIDSLSQKHACRPAEIRITATTLFVTSYAPNDRYALGSCCLIDEVGYVASMETVKAFAHFVSAIPRSTAYVVVYGGTNVYGLSIPPGPEKMVRRLDRQSFVARLGGDVRQQMSASGVDRSRVISLNGGYRDTSASIDLWIIPPGGKRPKPTPNYFRRTKPRASTARHH